MQSSLLVRADFAMHREGENECSFIQFIHTQEGTMRHLATLTGVMLLIAVSGTSYAAPKSPTGLSKIDNPSSVQLVQDKPKSDTITKRVKRAWKDLSGYKFDVGCPVILPISHRTCTETGKNREDARAKCVSANPFCWVTQASK